MGSDTVFFLSAALEERVFGLDTQTLFDIIIQLVNTFVLAGALLLILYKPVRSFLHKRAEKIANQMQLAEENLIKADEAKIKYEEKIKDIERERAEVLEAARRLGIEKRTEILNAAKAEADAMRERARNEIAREQKRVQEELRLYIIEASSLMAGKIMEHNVDKEMQDKLFAETIAELDMAAWLN